MNDVNSNKISIANISLVKMIYFHIEACHKVAKEMNIPLYLKENYVSSENNPHPVKKVFLSISDKEINRPFLKQKLIGEIGNIDLKKEISGLNKNEFQFKINFEDKGEKFLKKYYHEILDQEDIRKITYLLKKRLSDQKNESYSELFEYVYSHPEAVNIINSVLLEENIEQKETLKKIIVRDLIIKYFPKEKNQFTALESCQSSPVFMNEDKDIIHIYFNYLSLEQNYPVKYAGGNFYSVVTDIFAQNLVLANIGVVNTRLIGKEVEEESTKEKILFSIEIEKENPHQLNKKALEQLFEKYLEEYVNNLPIINSANPYHELNNRLEIEKKIDQKNLQKWLNSLCLKNKLEILEENMIRNKPKI